MTARITKPQCVLLDANVVIKAHELNIWLHLTDQYQLILPSTVIRNEARYFKAASGVHAQITLQPLVEQGKITELTATIEELANVNALFASWFFETLDPGEIEALALLKANKAPGAYFCSSDGPAIQALGMIAMSERGISMETLLIKVGLRKNLPKEYQERFFRKHLRLGQKRRITGEGLAIA